MATLSFSSFQILLSKPCNNAIAIPNFGPKPRTGFRILSSYGSDRGSSSSSDEFGLISTAERSDGSIVFRFGNIRDVVVVEKAHVSSSSQAKSRSQRQRSGQETQTIGGEVIGNKDVVGDVLGDSAASLLSKESLKGHSTVSTLRYGDDHNNDEAEDASLAMEAEAKDSDANGVTTDSGSLALSHDSTEASAEMSTLLSADDDHVQADDSILALEGAAKDSDVDGVTTTGSVSSEVNSGQLGFSDESTDAKVTVVITPGDEALNEIYTFSSNDNEAKNTSLATEAAEANNGDVDGVTVSLVSSELEPSLSAGDIDSNVNGATTGLISYELELGQIAIKDETTDGEVSVTHTIGEVSLRKETTRAKLSTEPQSETTRYEVESETSIQLDHNAPSTNKEEVEANIEQSDELIKLTAEEAPNSEEISTRELVLSYGAALLQLSPVGLTGGEDAYFVACENWLGVADGVGQWSLEGISSELYARELMKNCERIVSNSVGNPISNPEEALVRSVEETNSLGSSTILVAHLDGQAFHVANIGDSGFMIIRDGYVFHQSTPTVHAFNFSLHVERGEEDPSRLIQSYEIDLEEGDVIVTATDGLFDNLYDQEIALFVSKSLKSGLKPQEIAESLASKAQDIARSSSSSRTPFSDAAQAAGYVGYSGGKLDDVAVIVSLVQKKPSST